MCTNSELLTGWELSGKYLESEFFLPLRRHQHSCLMLSHLRSIFPSKVVDVIAFLVAEAARRLQNIISLVKILKQCTKHLALPHIVPVDIWVLNQNSSFLVFGLVLQGSLHKYGGRGGLDGKGAEELGLPIPLILNPQADQELH